MGAALDEMRRHHEAMKALDARMAEAIKRAEEDDAALDLGIPEPQGDDDAALWLDDPTLRDDPEVGESGE